MLTTCSGEDLKDLQGFFVESGFPGKHLVVVVSCFEQKGTPVTTSSNGFLVVAPTTRPNSEKERNDGCEWDVNDVLMRYYYYFCLVR